MKKVISLIAALTLLVSMLAFNASAASDIEFSITKVEGKPGDTVTVDVMVDKNIGTWAMLFDVKYNSKYLSLLSVTNGSVFKDSEHETGDGKIVDNGSYRYYAMKNELKEETKTGKLVTFEFKILKAAPNGEYEIDIFFPDNGAGWFFGIVDANSYDLIDRTVELVSKGSVKVVGSFDAETEADTEPEETDAATEGDKETEKAPAEDTTASDKETEKNPAEDTTASDKETEKNPDKDTTVTDKETEKAPAEDTTASDKETEKNPDKNTTVTDKETEKAPAEDTTASDKETEKNPAEGTTASDKETEKAPAEDTTASDKGTEKTPDTYETEIVTEFVTDVEGEVVTDASGDPVVTEIPVVVVPETTPDSTNKVNGADTEKTPVDATNVDSEEETEKTPETEIVYVTDAEGEKVTEPDGEPVTEIVIVDDGSDDGKNDFPVQTVVIIICIIAAVVAAALISIVVVSRRKNDEEAEEASESEETSEDDNQ